MGYVYQKARAKINLTLDVLGKRPDGYHELETVMQSISLADTLRLETIAQPRVVVKTNLPYLPVDKRNLATAVLEKLRAEFGLPGGMFLQLTKHIPVAAGLAGGSTDAAAALLAANKLFGLRLSIDELCRIGAQLGSDVPFCIRQGTLLARGRGEELTRLPDCPPFWVVLAKPPVSVSTAAVYQGLRMETVERRPDTAQMLEALRTGNRAGVAAELCNVLESVTLLRYPVIGQIQERLRAQGAVGVLMSGSGPTAFGLFLSQGQAARAAEAVSRELGLKEVFVTSTWQPGGED